MSREKYNYAQEQCIRSAGKLMQSTGMLRPGARVGVAVSGGADSWALIKVLKIRRGIVPFPVELMALHLNPGFDPQGHAPLAEWLREQGIAAHLELTDYGPRAHSGENRKNAPCYFCAMLRRKRLFELCRQYGLTHLAFGHTAEDLVSTFFMNLCQTGRVDGLNMKEAFFNGRLTVIRPLMLVEKPVILRAVAKWALPVRANPCPSAGHTRRTGILEELDAFCGTRKWMRKNISNGLIRWQHAQHAPDEKKTSSSVTR